MLYNTIVMVYFELKSYVVKSDPYNSEKFRIESHKSGYIGVALSHRIPEFMGRIRAEWMKRSRSINQFSQRVGLKNCYYNWFHLMCCVEKVPDWYTLRKRAKKSTRVREYLFSKPLSFSTTRLHKIVFCKVFSIGERQFCLRRSTIAVCSRLILLFILVLVVVVSWFVNLNSI